MVTAMDIYKLLPKTNCGKCGVPTCLAFAMKLANKQTELNACPDVSQEAKETLESSAAPPIKLITIGKGANKVEVGNETELFRHEKKFYHPSAYSLLLEDSLSSDTLLEKVEAANALEFERIGQTFKLDLIAVKATGDGAEFAAAVKAVHEKTDFPMILISDDPKIMDAGLQIAAEDKPLIYCATDDNWQQMAELAKRHNCPLAVRADGLDALAELTPKLKNSGTDNLVIDFGEPTIKDDLMNLTIIRRLAVKKTFRPLGYPVIRVFGSVDPETEAVMADLCTMKYASIVVLNDISRWKMYPIFTLRQNIYTDPQKPIQVEPKVYPIGTPSPESPLLFTTNFSLTYFIVAGDIEKSKIPAHLLVVDTEGLSVMTAFAADKLTVDHLVKAIADNKLAETLAHKNLVIPGMVARMKGKLEETTGWNVMVGPRDSSALPKYLKEHI